jgi:regulator of protease activity HflC (stomatin/prohibitin superfamily)
MGFGILIIVIGLVMFFGSRFAKPGSPLATSTRGLERWGLVLAGVGVVLAVLAQAIVVVPNGRAGVVFNAFQGVRPGVIEPGTHIVIPVLENVTFYPSLLQELTLSRRGEGGPDIDESIKALSKEGLEISADVTVQYQIIPAKAPALHKSVGPTYVNTVIRPQVRSKIRDGIGSFNAADLISTQRKALENTVTESLRQVFQDSNLELRGILLREIRIPDSVAKAIEEKQTAEQRVQTERNNREAERIRAETAVVKAEGESKAAIARAQGESKSLSLRGQALRQNPEIIQLTVAEKLAPTIQTVMLPAQGNFLLDIGSLTKRVTK